MQRCTHAHGVVLYTMDYRNEPCVAQGGMAVKSFLTFACNGRAPSHALVSLAYNTGEVLRRCTDRTTTAKEQSFVVLPPIRAQCMTIEALLLSTCRCP